MRQTIHKHYAPRHTTRTQSKDHMVIEHPRIETHAERMARKKLQRDIRTQLHLKAVHEHLT